MSRTTVIAVQGIIEHDANISLTPFIEVASELVTEVCVDKPAAAGDTSPYSSARLELIERWLAAHFYAIRDPRTTDERAGSVGASFESKVDLGLSITRYGQQAMLLDTKGGLASENAATKKGGRSRAGVHYVGTIPASTQSALDAD